MWVRGVCAANVCVKAFDTVYQAMRLKEVERAVYGRWGGARLIGAELFEQIVGEYGLVRAPHEFKDALTRAGQPCLIFLAYVLRAPQRITNTTPMVVPARFETGDGFDFHAFTVAVRFESLYHNIYGNQ